MLRSKPPLLSENSLKCIRLNTSHSPTTTASRSFSAPAATSSPIGSLCFSFVSSQSFSSGTFPSAPPKSSCGVLPSVLDMTLPPTSARGPGLGPISGPRHLVGQLEVTLRPGFWTPACTKACTGQDMLLPLVQCSAGCWLKELFSTTRCLADTERWKPWAITQLKVDCFSSRANAYPENWLARIRVYRQTPL